MEKVKPGDIVRIECVSGLGSGGLDKVTKITTKYDVDTGKPHRVLWCGKHGFRADSGAAITTPSGYYIQKVS